MTWASFRNAPRCPNASRVGDCGHRDHLVVERRVEEKRQEMNAKRCCSQWLTRDDVRITSNAISPVYLLDSIRTPDTGSHLTNPKVVSRKMLRYSSRSLHRRCGCRRVLKMARLTQQRRLDVVNVSRAGWTRPTRSPPVMAPEPSIRPRRMVAIVAEVASPDEVCWFVRVNGFEEDRRRCCSARMHGRKW